ncbi:stromal interaction molecule homolog [Uloborus diversus]|uniref:stromal interaction molecule homolog n=1 Tax=Uloborus diversus TaxID=327109 RepID=UPI002409745D|nr:stromal interaction molecule homolog [Uloborus diversus]
MIEKFFLSFFVLTFYLFPSSLENNVNGNLDSKEFSSELDPDGTKSSWNCEVLDACDDKHGFEAILMLHQRLDDDANGNIDISESDEFLRDELNYASGYERQKIFHKNDKHISVDELWSTWKTSEVHNWTVQETIQWLLTYVDLPQYTKNFEENSVDGTSLPRMAVNSMHFLSNLGIKDPIHKHKISLKAMDVVLFGPSRNHNYFKDIILLLSLGIATCGCWFAFMQHKKSQSQLKKTMKDMESLQHAEESLQELQKELDKAKLEQEMVVTEKRNLERRLQDEIITVKLKHQDSSGISDVDQLKIQRLEEELRIVTEDLRCAERALQAKKWFPSPALQHWLQLTHELELRHYNEKKTAAEKQLAAAKEGCEKLRKKRTSFMGAFRVAHGSSIDDVDNRILQAKSALSEVTKDLQERLNRWKQIEVLCGFSIVHNPGIRHLESLLGTSMNIIASSNSVTPRMTRRNSEGTLTDEETTSVTDPGISARSLANIPFVCNQRTGLNLNFGQMRRSPSSDLKSVASSSAILQRSNAFHIDLLSDSSFLEGKDVNSAEEISPDENVRPMFTVGSKEFVIKPMQRVSESETRGFLQDPSLSFLPVENESESSGSLKYISDQESHKITSRSAATIPTSEGYADILNKNFDASTINKKYKIS